MQSLTRAKPQKFDHACDGGGQGGAQGFFQRPERLLVVLRCNKKNARRIKAETLQPLPIWPAKGGNVVRSGDNEHRTACAIRLRNAPKKGHRETESGRYIGGAAGRNFMQCPERQPPLRQMRIKRGKAERERGCRHRNPVRLRQHPAKILHGFFAGLREGFWHQTAA